MSKGLKHPFYVMIACAVICTITSCKPRTDKDEWNKHHQIVHHERPADLTYYTNDGLCGIDAQGPESIDVTYVAYACDCPMWVQTSVLDSPMGRYRDEHSYYIERVDNNSAGFDTIDHYGMRLMLYGRMDTVKRYPRNARFIDPDPPLGKVFIYCGYHVLHQGRIPVTHDDTFDIDP